VLLLTVILVLLGIGLSFYGYWRIEKKIGQHQAFINQALSEIEGANSQIVNKTSEGLEKILLGVDSQTALLSDLSERLETFASKTLAHEFFDGRLPYPEGLMDELRNVGVDLKQAREQSQAKQALANAIMYDSQMRELPVEKRK
jgi:hypothetical protein